MNNELTIEQAWNIVADVLSTSKFNLTMQEHQLLFGSMRMLKEKFFPEPTEKKPETSDSQKTAPENFENEGN